MKKNVLILIFVSLIFCTMSCALESQGDSLEPLLKEGAASVGKTYVLTLIQINIEIDKEGLYVRAFDSKYKTIFMYFDESLKKEIANLERGKKYMYKFKVTKNDKPSTLSGQLITVADHEGKGISGSLIDTTVTVKTIRLDGKNAEGKNYNLDLMYEKMGRPVEGKKYAQFRSIDNYRFSVNGFYKADLEKDMKNLKVSGRYTVGLKILRNGIAIDAEIASIAPAKEQAKK